MVEERKVNDTYLVLCATRLHLVSENLRAGLLGLRFVNVLHQHTLVSEDVTLRLHVERMVPDRNQ